jgi:Ran-binding protein 3
MQKDSIKRKHDESEFSDPKKLKGTLVDSSGEEIAINVEELRSQIVKEVTEQFHSKIIKLEDEVKHLKLLILNDKTSAESSVEPVDASEKRENGQLDGLHQDSANDSTLAVGRKAPTLAASTTKKTSAEATVKPTFGASLFTIKPTIATPLNSFLSQSSETPKDKTAENSPRPVFGATTSFSSNAFENIKAKKNVFDDLPSTATGTTSQPVTSSFGANSKFGLAFQESLKKKSFLDSSENTEKQPPTTKTTPQLFKQVELEQVKSIQTGEEDEVSLYHTSAKLFELDFGKISDGWKERGLGPLHLNQSKSDKNQVRLVMRSHGLLRVILNYKITPKTDFLKGLEASLNPGKYLRLNSVNAEGTLIQYMLKFGSESIRDELCEKAEKVKGEILVTE